MILNTIVFKGQERYTTVAIGASGVDYLNNEVFWRIKAELEMTNIG